MGGAAIGGGLRRGEERRGRDGTQLLFPDRFQQTDRL
jgi:hypothetical protein